MSVHKNFIEGYGRDWNKLCNEKLLPYQNEIFKLFSEKFYIDAEKDGERGRELLRTRGNKCGDICNEIHTILGGNDTIDNNIRNLVNNIVNLDYNSLSEVFHTLKNEYSKAGDGGITNEIEIICTYLEKMWRISSPRTIIQEKTQ